jgi:hypothetical protein
MPRCHVTGDENDSPPWEGQGPRGPGVGCGTESDTHPGASRLLSLHATPPMEGIFRSVR